MKILALTSKDAYNLFHEGQIALAEVESNGIKIDVERLKRTREEVSQEIQKIDQELKSDPIYTAWNKKFGNKTKIGSKEQLGVILFDVMGLENTEITPTGRHKVDISVLSGIDLPFVKNFIKIEKLKKLRSTYIDGVLNEVCDGYLHPSFNLNLASTYRSTSSNPNFQNFPTRNADLSKLIRSCFIPRRGRYLLELDYSGIEVRIAACYHKDPTMIEYIKDPSKDMHRDMAGECYLLEKNQIGKQTRYVSKNMFVFPEFYGSFYVECAKNMWEAIDTLKLKVRKEGDGKEDTGIDLREHLKSKGITELGKCEVGERPLKGTFEFHIKEVEDNFWNKRFPVYKQWKIDWYESYLENGYADTLNGFRFYWGKTGICAKNDIINYPVQGVAFHCLLWSLIEINKEIKKRSMKTVIVGQIHDSLLSDVPEKELQDYINLCKEIMTKKLVEHWKFINIPLDIEVEVVEKGSNWFEKTQWIQKDGIWSN